MPKGGDGVKRLVVALLLLVTAVFSSPVFASARSEDSGIELIDLTEYVKGGEMARIEVKGEPHTMYAITVRYSSGLSEADGLSPKTSNAEGKTVWTWKVGSRTRAGSWPITIQGPGGQHLQVHFQVG